MKEAQWSSLVKPDAPVGDAAAAVVAAVKGHVEAKCRAAGSGHRSKPRGNSRSSPHASKPSGRTSLPGGLLTFALLAAYTWNSNVRMGHWKNTKTLFETDAAHWSRSAKVLHSAGSELQSSGDIQGALDKYLASLQVFDDQAITDYCIARCLIHLNRHQEAYDRFNKILNGHGIGFHDGNDFLWMTDLGYLLVKLGAHAQGAHYLEEGLKRMPYSCYGWNALGVSQANQGQLERAVQSLMEGLQCDPQSASIWINLAVVYAYGNVGQEATKALEKAVALNATRPEVLHNQRVLTSTAPGAQPVYDLFIPLPGRR